MRPVYDFAAFSPLMFSDLITALGAEQPEKQQPWTWATVGVRAFEQQLANLHYWLDVVASNIAIQVNAMNPINKLPDEILCMIFAEVIDGPDDIDSRVVLSEVCRHWQDIVYNNKASWANIAYNEADGGARLSQLRWRMERSAPAPLDLDLVFRAGLSAQPAEELIREHLYHTRSLALVAHKDVLERHWRTALTMPAPLLAKLGLTAHVPYTREWSDGQAVPFPANMFSGSAPRLGELFLDRVSLPRSSWSPLRSLETLTIRLASVDPDHLSRLVRACPSLRQLRVIAWHSFETVAAAFAGDTPHPALLHPGPITTVMLRPANASPSYVDRFLRSIGCPNPLRFGLVLRDMSSNLFWFVDAMLNTPMTALHLSSCDDADDGFTVTATAHNSEGKTRAACLEIGGLATFAPAFVYLRELTIPERMWPSNGFPALPNLHTLTIVLEDPGVAESRSVSIFLLSLTPGVFWDIPSLRTLSLAYVAADEAEFDGPACWAKQAIYTVPLIISALEVATFLNWNLHDGHPLRVVLQNVVLFEQPDSFPMQRLRGLVQDIVLEPGYLPKVLEGMSLGYP